MKAFTNISAKYTNFADIFSTDLVFKLFKHTGINNHTIKLVNCQQTFYGLIYSLKPVELEIQKTNIETNLANGFLRLFKSLINIPIFLTKS